ncbi:unnamed protein product [Ilex paraguariensis]|uniref:Prefoldin subunit 6 n=1 Tax=Ilex paraguariensis TaxID=185542 RepID=A0ABC8TNL1_9AQUA
MGSSTALEKLQRELEIEANDLSELQKGDYIIMYICTSSDILKNHQVRKKYTIQLGENELALKLNSLNEDTNLCILEGPVFVRQDLAEANATVRKRIEYIAAELERMDAILQDLEEKQNSKKDVILKLQQGIQSLYAGNAKT